MRLDRPWAAAPRGLVLTVRLTPKGGRDAIEGIASLADGASVLKARVSAPPRDGAANAALVRLVAKTLRVAPNRVTIVGGETARVKRVEIAGDGPTLASILEKLCAAE